MAKSNGLERKLADWNICFWKDYVRKHFKSRPEGEGFSYCYDCIGSNLECKNYVWKGVDFVDYSIRRYFSYIESNDYKNLKRLQ